MRTATTLKDAQGLEETDIFDLEGAYASMLATITRDSSRQGHFHPSGVGMCERKQVYEFTYTPFIPNVPADSIEIFDLGHAIHEMVGRRLSAVGQLLKPRRIGYDLQLEVPFDPTTDKLFAGLTLGGTSDAVLTIWADTWKQRSIVEMKSVNRKGFDDLLLEDKPKEEHLMQAHLYAYRFDCPIIYVWYFCKDNSQRKVFARPFNQAVFKAAINYFEKLMQHVEAGTLPERKESYYMCHRCEYRNICKPAVITTSRDKLNTKTSALRKHGKL